MATSEMKKEFQRRIRQGINQEEHTKRVREALMKHKYVSKEDIGKDKEYDK